MATSAGERLSGIRMFFVSIPPIVIGALFLSSCSLQKQISKSALQVINDSALRTAHIGISIYEPAENKYWYNHDGDKYFVPASNTKLPTCYAAMKYLGDSLVGLWYQQKDDTIYNIRPAADPTFLHPDYSHQPVLDFFKKTYATGYYNFKWDSIWREKGLGSGWSWDDYMETYMAERWPFPVYGNLIRFKKERQTITHIPGGMRYDPIRTAEADSNRFRIERLLGTNFFFTYPSSSIFDSTTLTLTNLSNFNEFATILGDALSITGTRIPGKIKADEPGNIYNNDPWLPIKTQPVDSLLKPMMHRSDNFFAEQSLLMVSNTVLGYMSDDEIIARLLKTDLKDLPQKPRWADGSGLSRYNLFTPQDFVAILNKMRNEFGIERMKNILPTGGEGTLGNYYKKDKGYIYAKTGSLSGVICLSGYLYTRKDKLLIFSILVNNHSASVGNIRHSIEDFLSKIRQNY